MSDLRRGLWCSARRSLEVHAHYSYSYADAPPLHVLLYHLGRSGSRPQLQDDAQLDWVRRQRAGVPPLTSVGAGSLVYAVWAAGWPTGNDSLALTGQAH